MIDPKNPSEYITEFLNFLSSVESSYNFCYYNIIVFICQDMSAIFCLLHKNKKRNNILFVQFVHQYCFLNLLFNYLEPSLNAIDAEFFSIIIKKRFFRTTFITIITNNLIVRATCSQTRQSALYAPIFNLYHYYNSLFYLLPIFFCIK